MTTTTAARNAETVRATIELENMLGNHIERRPRVWGEDADLPQVRGWAARIAPTFWDLAARALDIAEGHPTAELVQDAVDLVAAAAHLDALAANR